MKYLKLTFVLLKQSLMRELAFRGNFLLAISTNLLWFLISIVFFRAIYLHVASINNWTVEETMLLVAVSESVHLLYKGFSGKSISSIPNLIRSGSLDHLLLKPVDSQFLVSLRRVDYYSLISLIFPFTLLIYSMRMLDVSVYIPHILTFALFLLAGVFVLYCIGLSIVSLAFWLTQVYALYALFQEVFSLSMYPESIFQGATRLFFAFVVPILIIANYPTLAIIGKDIRNLWLPMLLTVVFWGWTARRLWFYGMTHYTSASS
jgi:ABC-2 type transport system permease protein